ncbi:4'-phosphopantetheinyl transferase superfamily protein [Bradyrhizobium viridifuturi]|nr:4'-phosphopantetheinyl transferase superfamily protein [Bradyrhizobium viridifuturi]MBR1044969.1 4'-phosphopantetheinyl transferase superfamily protein [Bradyrhizobium viridifuturi]MBR1084086.1 4'-phosphopantetheinyl transferase superfamily protein [Bradyrhizobium viridifuturi]MBR1096363.1 4'-phosphopantetheinyl transferase superfamily protein [Bradyrhizobium viridifuturi]MBR1103445.1 4'-phosphopantetheinyl transferase superfamily protein [Bradyrhizobium viridifuturi]
MIELAVAAAAVAAQFQPLCTLWVSEDGQVVVITMMTETLSTIQERQLKGGLSQAEGQRAQEFYWPADRRDYVVSHALLRMLLAEWLLYRPDGLILSPDVEGGKPRLHNVGCQHVDFSLSHTNSLVAVTVATNDRVGVDVEALDRTLVSSFPELVCSANEMRWLDGHAPQEKHNNMLRLWTLKEAVLKAVGYGLVCEPRFIEVSLDPPRLLSAPTVLVADRNWVLMQWRPTSRHVLALALGT